MHKPVLIWDNEEDRYENTRRDDLIMAELDRRFGSLSLYEFRHCVNVERLELGGMDPVDKTLDIFEIAGRQNCRIIVGDFPLEVCEVAASTPYAWIDPVMIVPVRKDGRIVRYRTINR